LDFVNEGENNMSDENKEILEEAIKPSIDDIFTDPWMLEPLLRAPS
jgi:hypothetical protein